VERVVLNALATYAGLASGFNPSAFVGFFGIVFGAATDAKQRPGFPPNPPTPSQSVALSGVAQQKAILPFARFFSLIAMWAPLQMIRSLR
jgi:hypothetical protein